MILLICGIKKCNELIYKIETDSQVPKATLWSRKGKDGKNEEVGINIYPLLYKVDNQQRSTV